MVGFDSDENKMIQLKVEEDQVSSGSQSIFNYCEKIQGKLFTCIICGTDFSRKYTLNKHFLKNHDGKSENCEICNKAFFEKHEYEYHLTVCEKLKCECCDASFSNLSEIPKHMKDFHGEDRPFKCKICPGSFQGSKI